MIDTSVDVKEPLASGDFPLRRVSFTYDQATRFEICKYLLEKGAKNKINEKQNSELPLEWAIYQNDPKLVQLFIDHGANINLQGSKGRSLLQIAQEKTKASWDHRDKDWDAKHNEILRILTPSGV
ncbi:MAG: ankyrin repeat domain-containing protein [Parachlamydiaceae bacterium]|nr:MAG: ankyrin repeat domain-containing protein [Parachlamydiaceae bacterium]